MARVPTGLRNVAILLLIWEIAGRMDLVASGALPGFSEILIRLWEDRADYPRHIWATLYASGVGFLIGNAIALMAGVAFAMSPTLLRLFRGVNIAVFALPPIAIAPILVLTLSGMAPRIVLAALAVYFVTMTATVIGISQSDSRASDLVKAYGGGRWRILWLVQLRSALPTIITGFQIAAPNAVLGAILAEFGGGGRWGLGTYLLGSLGRGEPDRLWGIGLIATAIAGLGYLVLCIDFTALDWGDARCDVEHCHSDWRGGVYITAETDHDADRYCLSPIPFVVGLYSANGRTCDDRENTFWGDRLSVFRKDCPCRTRKAFSGIVRDPADDFCGHGGRYWLCLSVGNLDTAVPKRHSRIHACGPCHANDAAGGAYPALGAHIRTRHLFDAVGDDLCDVFSRFRHFGARDRIGSAQRTRFTACLWRICLARNADGYDPCVLTISVCGDASYCSKGVAGRDDC